MAGAVDVDLSKILSDQGLAGFISVAVIMGAGWALKRVLGEDGLVERSVEQISQGLALASRLAMLEQKQAAQEVRVEQLDIAARECNTERAATRRTVEAHTELVGRMRRALRRLAERLNGASTSDISEDLRS